MTMDEYRMIEGLCLMMSYYYSALPAALGGGPGLDDRPPWAWGLGLVRREPGEWWGLPSQGPPGPLSGP